MYLAAELACANLYTLFVALAMHTNSISVGMSQGFSAVLIPQLQRNDSAIRADAEESSWIASLGVISTPIGALASGFFAEGVGRKTTMQITSIPFFAGWLMMGLSTDKMWLYIGRFVTGFAIGMASTLYVYLAEISKPSERGMLASLGPVLVSFGVLLVYLFGYTMDWHVASVVCAGVAAFSFFVIFFLPETPPYLASRGNYEGARKTLVRLRRSNDAADREMTLLMSSTSPSKSSHSLLEYLSKFKEPTVWKPFIILVFFFLFQEGSGMYVIVYYATNVFHDLGAVIDSSLESIIVGLVRLVTSAFGTFCIQTFGRKPMSIVSSLLMGLSMGAASIYNYIYGEIEDVNNRPLPYFPFVCVMVNVGASMLGMLQLPWLMIGELFPLSVRGFVSGVISSLAYLFIFAIIKIYPNLMSTLELSGMMALFSVTSLLTVVFVVFFLPETKGKQLIEIENSFKTKDILKNEKDEKNTENSNPVYVLKL